VIEAPPRSTWTLMRSGPFARLWRAGLISASPQKIISDGTDWRFLNEIKKEMKT
jgi:hypothetical protein